MSALVVAQPREKHTLSKPDFVANIDQLLFLTFYDFHDISCGVFPYKFLVQTQII